MSNNLCTPQLSLSKEGNSLSKPYNKCTNCRRAKIIPLNDKLQDTLNDTLKDILKDTLNDTLNDKLKDTLNDKLKDTLKGTLNEIVLILH